MVILQDEHRSYLQIAKDAQRQEEEAASKPLGTPLDALRVIPGFASLVPQIQQFMAGTRDFTASQLEKVGVPGLPTVLRAEAKMLRGGAGMVRGASEVFAPEGGTKVGDVSEAVGQGIAFITATALTGGSSSAAVAARVATLGALANGGAAFEEAKHFGASDEVAMLSLVGNAVVGTSEAFPLARILNRINKLSGGTLVTALKHAAIEGAEEAGQEYGQTIAGNIIAQHLYDEEREWLQDAAEGGKLGFLAGVILSGLGSGAGAYIDRYAQPEQTTTEGGGATTGTQPEMPPKLSPEEEVEVLNRSPFNVEIEEATEPWQKKIQQDFREAGSDVIFAPIGDERLGMYDRRAGVAILNSEADPGVMENAIAIHEAGHLFNQIAEEAKQRGDGDYFTRVMDNIRGLDSGGLAIAEKIAKENNPDAAEEVIQDETLAEYMSAFGPFLAQQNNLQELAESSPTLFGTIIEMLRRIVSRFTGTQYDTPEVRAFKRMIVEVPEVNADIVQQVPMDKLPAVVQAVGDVLDWIKLNPLAISPYTLRGRARPSAQELAARYAEPQVETPAPVGGQELRETLTPTQQKRARQKEGKRGERPIKQEGLRRVERKGVEPEVKEKVLPKEKAKPKRKPAGTKPKLKVERKPVKPKAGETKSELRKRVGRKATEPQKAGPKRAYSKGPAGVFAKEQLTRRAEPTKAEAAAEAFEAGEDIRFSTAPNVNLEEAKQQGMPLLKKGKASLKRHLRARGLMPRQAFDWQRAGASWHKSQMTRAEKNVADLEDAIIDAGWAKRITLLSPEQAKQISLGLQNPVNRNALPEIIRAPVQVMRDHIDEMSNHLIKIGAAQGDLALILTENMDLYVHRSYKIFDPGGKEWIKKIPEDQMQTAIGLWKEMYPDLSESEAHGTILKMLNSAAADGNPFQFHAKLNPKQLQIFKRRKLGDNKVDETIRNLFGEYGEPQLNYTRSVFKQAQIAAAHQWMGKVREQYMGTLFSETPDADKGFVHEIEATPRLDPLTLGKPLYATEEFAEAITATTRDYNQGWLHAWLWVNGIAKYGKTIASVPMTHMRNFVANPMFMVADGHFLPTDRLIKNIKRVREAGKVTATEMSYLNQFIRHRLKPLIGKDGHQLLESLVEQGIVRDSAHAGEIVDSAKDAYKNWEQWMQSRAKSRFTAGFKQVLRTLERTYQAEDDFWKVMHFLSEKQRLIEVAGWSDAKATEYAAKITRDHMPTYSMVASGLKAWRKMPLMGTFISFPSEVVRTTKNRLKTTAQEMKSDDAGLRKVGYQRLMGQLMVPAITTIPAIALRAIYGVTADDDEDARLFLPPWSKNSTIWWFGNDEKGNRNWVDLSYTDPFQYIQEPIQALVRGENWEEKLKRSVWAAFEPYLAPEIATQAIGEVIFNHKIRTGGQVYNEEAPIEDIAWDMAGHLKDGLEPGAITQFERMLKAVQGKVSPWGKTYDPVTEFFSMNTGFRINKMDVNTALFFRAGDFQKSTTEATQLLTRKARSRGTVSEGDIREAYADMENARRKHFRKMYRAAQGAMGLGYSEREVRRILRGRMSQKSVSNILRNRYEPYDPSSSFLAEEIRSAGDRKKYRDRIRLVRELARDARREQREGS